MARTEITVALGVVNSSAIVTPLAIQPGATGLSGYAVQDSTFDNRLGLLVTNSGSATGTIEIKASDFYENKGKGDIVITVGGSVTKLIGPLDGTQVRQASGYINVDSVGVTGTISAVEIG
jgi:hypothetical protein